MTCKKQQHPANMRSDGLQVLQPTSLQSFLYTTVKLNLFLVTCSRWFSVFRPTQRLWPSPIRKELSQTCADCHLYIYCSFIGAYLNKLNSPHYHREIRLLMHNLNFPNYRVKTIQDQTSFNYRSPQYWVQLFFRVDSIKIITPVFCVGHLEGKVLLHQTCRLQTPNI